MSALLWVLVPAVVASPAIADGLRHLDGPLRLAVAVAALAAGFVGVVLVPQLRWRRWRWEVRDEEIDLRHGAFTEVRTIVPMARVQHVDVRRSILQRGTATADLVVHTAAGRTRIPMLSDDAAIEVRDRIADLARAPDEL